MTHPIHLDLEVVIGADGDTLFGEPASIDDVDPGPVVVPVLGHHGPRPAVADVGAGADGGVLELERRLPDRFIPRYSMVMFHAEIPYLVAQQRGEVQKALLEEFTQEADDLAGIDLDAATRAAVDRLPPLATLRNSNLAVTTSGT